MSERGNKVYFPVESLMGLGHLNRTGKLVREMVRNGLDVTVASGSFVDPQRFFAGANLREIPPIVIKGRDVYFTLNADGTRTVKPLFNEAAQRGERTRAHLENIAEVRPDVVVSEFWPFNRAQVDEEMGAILERTKTSDRKILKIASVRDVLDPPGEGKSPEIVARHLEREAFAVKTINENFDAVLVHGDPNFIPLSETFGSANQLKVPVIYTGYVVDEMPKRTVTADDPDAPVVVSCGAGADCHELIFSFLTSWQKLLDRRDEPEVAKLVNRPVIIISGPRFEPNTYKEIEDWSKAVAEQSGHPVSVEHYRKDFTSLLANAAFSVSFAGYNTTLETLATGVPAVLVPNFAFYSGRMKMNSEQLYRLERLSEKGYAAYAHPNDVVNAKKFANIMLNEYTRQSADNTEKPRLNFDGAQNTINAINDLLRKQDGAAPTPVANLSLR